MTATYRPWRVTEYGEVLGSNNKTVVANGFATVASPGDWQNEARANAAFAVQAVNSHDALVAFVSDFARRDPVFAKGNAKDDILKAKALVAALSPTEGERG